MNVVIKKKILTNIYNINLINTFDTILIKSKTKKKRNNTHFLLKYTDSKISHL